MMHKAWSSIEEVPIVGQGHPSNFKVTRDKKIAAFDTNWAFPDCNFTLNSLMAMKWRIKLEATSKRSPIVFQDRPSNFKATRDNKSPILTWIERFRTVTLVWIHRWLWNDAQSLKQQRRGALLFVEVIHQISRSHGTKNRRFWPQLSVSRL